MPWSIRLKTGAAKAINKLDKPVRDRIKAFLDQLAEQDNPRIAGKALQGKLSAYWRYRVGDYRLICQIQDDELIVLVVELGHRKDIYRDKH
ncbi:RelE/StbE family addiction module toxin [Methylomonas albis]|uniref:Type II toxin-antitoxin system RelE/ParE family toxin n=1 Tax=Methylomonas albis TaxID=1854563 RepID=A0ABR9CZU4_9GAMM|nr:type II toxin-antitoxin system RelE/ParE family toxin [Methylomonas albis]MBD9356399.1 type II toxin-antitoxin system RelE/ParE family toxin [Methylomonas albis]CAD6879500.1 RelE/StbE family addiction module toxin [Methylomonas albis]